VELSHHPWHRGLLAASLHHTVIGERSPPKLGSEHCCFLMAQDSQTPHFPWLREQIKGSILNLGMNYLSNLRLMSYWIKGHAWVY
jgi:hypothetical protein